MPTKFRATFSSGIVLAKGLEPCIALWTPEAFDAFAAWCAKRQDCALGTDPAKANQAFRDLTLPLVQRPVAVGERKLSYNDAITGAIQAMYSEELWAPLNTGLTELPPAGARPWPRHLAEAILAGYAWDESNPYVREPRRRLAALEELCS